MDKLKFDIGQRFKKRKLNAGFTRVTYLGRRKNDSAKMALIEIIGNKYEIQINKKHSEILK